MPDAVCSVLAFNGIDETSLTKCKSAAGDHAGVAQTYASFERLTVRCRPRGAQVQSGLSAAWWVKPLARSELATRTPLRDKNPALHAATRL